MSYTLNHSGAEIDDLLGFLDANEYKDATVTLDDGSSLSLQNITSGSRLGLIFAVLNRWYQSIVFKSANGDVAISGAGTVGGGLTVTGSISATGGLTTGGGARVNGKVQADSLGVFGDSNLLGALSARSISATEGLTIGGGATVNGLVQANSLRVQGNSNTNGALTAESITSYSGVYAGGRVQDVGSPQSGTDAANKDYVDYVTSGKVPAMLFGDGAPTVSTAGESGQLYVNTLTACIYVCEGESNGVYLWRVLADSVDSDFVALGSIICQRGLFAEEYKVKRGVVNGLPSYTALNADDVGADADGTAASAVAAHNFSASAHSTLFAGKAKYVDLGTDVTTDDILASNIFDTATDAATIYRGACSLNNYGDTAWVFNTPYEEEGTVLRQVMLLGSAVFSRENWGTSWSEWSDLGTGYERDYRKASSITAGNSTSTIFYPSVKATVDYIATAITGAIEGGY